MALLEQGVEPYDRQKFLPTSTILCFSSRITTTLFFPSRCKLASCTKVPVKEAKASSIPFLSRWILLADHNIQQFFLFFFFIFSFLLFLFSHKIIRKTWFIQQQMVTKTLSLHRNIGDVSSHSSQLNRLLSELQWSKDEDAFHISYWLYLSHSYIPNI